MDRWTASAAGGISQRLYPRGATVRSRSSSDIRTTPSSRSPVRWFRTRSRLQQNPPRARGGPCGARRYTIRDVLRRALTPFLLALTLVLVLAPAAPAHDGGQGTFGIANDKVVTNAGFILIAFFPLFVFAMSMLQMILDRRKERRKAARKALAREDRVRGGW